MTGLGRDMIMVCPTIPLNMCGSVSDDKYCWSACQPLSPSLTGMEGNSHSPANSPVSWNRDTHTVWTGMESPVSGLCRIRYLPCPLSSFHSTTPTANWNKRMNGTWSQDICGPEGMYMFLSTCLSPLLSGVVGYPKTAEDRIWHNEHNSVSVLYVGVHG